VIDPIDGTVNYFYGIPHFCISIALRENGEIIVGVIYDPMRDELWHAELGGKAYLNDKPIEVSQYTDISQSVFSVGMSKTMAELEVDLSIFQDLLARARKCRMMGALHSTSPTSPPADSMLTSNGA
jgi:myo-inositol-1(or 4)-monophosphatase